MAITIAEVYDALLAAGAPDDKARAAAMAVSGDNQRLDRVEARLAKIEMELAVVKWICGANTAGIALLIGFAGENVG